MNAKLVFGKPADIETECLVAIAVDRGDAKKPQPAILGDKAIQNAAAELINSGEVTGKIFETVMLHRPEGLKAKRLLVVGGGRAKNFSAYELRKVAGTAVRFLKPKSIRKFAFAVPEQWAGQANPVAHSTFVYERGGSAEAVLAIVEGSYVGNFDPDIYKSDRKDQSIDEITLVVAGQQNPALQREMEEGRIIGESQNFTRELVNEPSNRMTPTKMAEQARAMVQSLPSNNVKIDVYGADKIKELKMGAFWSVAQGSDEPPALIVLRYEPEGAPEKPVIGLVGKGITFDSGGISIKPSDGMEKMKYDMAGGAAMLGAMRAIALLKPKVKVIAVVCATENMPSGHAQKPGDVQIAMSGKSIEIINTDAEGRLVLADGLAYAKQLGATHLIDAATLTGAVAVALGQINAGAFSNDEDTWQEFSKAVAVAGDRFWRLPLDEEYRDLMRYDISDIKITGLRYEGAITSAMFLKEFAEDTAWIHLDIASMTWLDEAKPWTAKGPTGVAVRSIIEWVRSYSR